MSWIYVLLGCLLGGVALYTVIPDLFLHRLGIGSWKRQYGPGVALTFDDGPNPAFTPRVLETLKKHQVLATFFVVAESARKYPELIKQIHDEGHQIGVHSLSHRYAWFATPWKTVRDWSESVEILEKITGEKISMMRPPWGTFNLATWYWLKKNKMRAVLWNAEGHDWEVRNTPKDIVERILKRTDEGTIIVLHDSGGELGAPDHSILALDQLCETLVQEKKLPIVPLEFPDWAMKQIVLFRVWEKWEHYYAKKQHVERVDATNIFRLERSIYEGPDILDKNGTLMAKSGDRVAELHLDSIRMQAKGRDMQKTAIKVIRQIQQSMPGLAQYVADDPTYKDIKIFLSLSLLHRGVKGFGFTVQDLPNTLKNKWIAGLQKMVMRVYHPAGKDRNFGRRGDKLMLVWISRETLSSHLITENKSVIISE